MNGNHSQKGKRLVSVTPKGIGLFHVGGSFTRPSHPLAQRRRSGSDHEITIQDYFLRRCQSDKIEKQHKTSKSKELLHKSREQCSVDNSNASSTESKENADVAAQIKDEKKHRSPRLLLSSPSSMTAKKGYWEQRIDKLNHQLPDIQVYSKLDIVKQGTLLHSADEEPQQLTVKQIFKGYSFYFNGITTENSQGNHLLSQSHLTHLAKLHGAVVLPHLAKQQLTHIICERVCQSKQERVLSLKKRLTFSSTRIIDGVAMNNHVLHYVKPSWITESIRQGRALPELEFKSFQDHTVKTLDSYLLMQNRASNK